MSQCDDGLAISSRARQRLPPVASHENDEPAKGSCIVHDVLQCTIHCFEYVLVLHGRLIPQDQRRFLDEVSKGCAFLQVT